MKKMALFFLFFLQMAFANDGISIHSVKNILRNDDSAILLLDDNSFWKIFSAKEVSQTWYQWWYNIVPSNPEKRFLCDFSEWEFFSKVEVSPFDIQNCDDLSKFHNQEINSCTYLIKNQKTGTFAFARPLQVEEFVFSVGAYEQKMNRLIKEEYERGYLNGRTAGYSSGYYDGYAAGSRDHQHH